MAMKAKAAIQSSQVNYDYRDAYTLINATVRQQQGRDALQAVDTASFVSVAQSAVNYGVESLFKAMSTLIGRTIFSSRPYKGKLQVMRVLYQRWGEIIRKVVYLSIDAKPTTSYNTVDSQPLQNGKTVDMYEINNPGVVQLTLNKILSLQTWVTRFRHQLNTAFHNESEFLAFWDAFMVEVMNSIESMNEARRRIVSLNAIAGTYAMGDAIDLAERYNNLHGTQYSRQQLLTTKFKDFMMFTAAEIKKVSKALTDRTEMYQATIDPLTADGKHILHHTPTSVQRLLMYAPIMTDQQTIVFPELFGPGYLDIMKYEEVNFWQNPENPSAVNINPAILDTATGLQKTAGEQNIPYVLAYLYDVEHMGNVEEFEETSVTPYNSAGKYWNIYFNWLFGAWIDYTEKHVLFIIGDGGAGEDETPTVDVRNIAGQAPSFVEGNLDVAVKMVGDTDTNILLSDGSDPNAIQVHVTNTSDRPVNTKEV